ncbi:uncharacterized protein LOC112083915 [Eutrema salsugineum]|uniref:uncharacterized protein LOC112083915 n=1 Tax=Eutrema salsugineum TaxID=72664 RepID=UPI000CED36CC|nr:uncharacterized protein LOC112083915 [Eutrema salsugineum]
MLRRFSREEKGKDIASSHRWIRDPPIRLHDEANPDLIEANRLTLIGRVLNPSVQKPKALIGFMPQIWRMEEKLVGRDLGTEKFQFKFNSEEDLQAVLNEAPFHFKRWMFVLQRWEPVISDAFPSLIPFWIRVHDIPSHCCTENNLKAIGNALGKYMAHDIEEAMVRVQIDALKPLIKKKAIQFPSGVEVSVVFEYIRLEKHCFLCMSLGHEKENCPQRSNSHDPEPPNSHINNQHTLQRLEDDRHKKEERRNRTYPSRQENSKQAPPRQTMPPYLNPSAEGSYAPDRDSRHRFQSRRSPNPPRRQSHSPPRRPSRSPPRRSPPWRHSRSPPRRAPARRLPRSPLQRPNDRYYAPPNSNTNLSVDGRRFTSHRGDSTPRREVPRRYKSSGSHRYDQSDTSDRRESPHATNTTNRNLSRNGDRVEQSSPRGRTASQADLQRSRSPLREPPASRRRILSDQPTNKHHSSIRHTTSASKSQDHLKSSSHGLRRSALDRLEAPRDIQEGSLPSVAGLIPTEGDPEWVENDDLLDPPERVDESYLHPVVASQSKNKFQRHQDSSEDSSEATIPDLPPLNGEKIPVAFRLGPRTIPVKQRLEIPKKATPKRRVTKAATKPSPKLAVRAASKKLMPSSPSQSVRSKRRTVSKKISPRKRLSVESKSHPPSKMSKVASVSASISNVNASNGELVASISKGIGNYLTVRRSLFPDIMFLAETKNQDDVVFSVFQWMGYDNRFTVPPIGLSGGLALFWKKDTHLEILSSSPNFIDTKIKRQEVWNQISELGANRDSAWLLSGDFNEILDNSEKRGGPRRHEGSFINFRSFISQNGLWDFNFSGNPLSWRGMRYDHFVRARLDRSVCNDEWLEAFPSGRSEYLRYEGSDHRPLVTFLDDSRVKLKGIFRFDNRLREKEEIMTLIGQVWNNSDHDTVVAKITDCRREIIRWVKEQNMNSAKLISDTQTELERALSADSPDPEVIGHCTATLEKAYKAEEHFWKQRSRILWLQSGDRNTGYFHAVTCNRRTCNRFTVLEDSSGTAFHEEQDFARIISEYFQEIFSSQNNSGFDLVHDVLEPQIDEETNARLIRIPDPAEIHSAVKSIHPSKAPGPDGFSAGFFHTYWPIIGPDLVKEIQEFFLSGSFPTRQNETHIRLIPKILGPRRVADYRPIALCNVYYKIVAKILTKRLQTILPHLISETQSAFVPNRAISDNVLITHETLHYLRTSEAKKRCFMAVKTDMSKAYDRIEWGVLRAVLDCLGFHHKWIKWIMECVMTVSYSFLINGGPQGRVLPSRGLRQGDPLSPYLFILCTEVLAGLCRKAQDNGSLVGIRVSRNSPQVNHLLYADDTMFFCKSDPTSCAVLSSILRRYGDASGQSINLAKSSITFSAKTHRNQRAVAKRILHIHNEGGAGKYLGLPEDFGRKKRDIFASQVDRIRQRSHSWATRFLSAAGKQVLLKSVLASMPSYAMSCFKLPKSLCKQIQSVLTRFWWDDKPDQRKMSWVSWNRLTTPLNAGGLGFRDIERFNDALLAKIGARLIYHPHALVSRVLLGKYCHSAPFMDCVLPSNPSHGRRSIIAGREILRHGMGWLVGNGESIRVWEDPWLSVTLPLRPIGPPTLETKDLLVSDLMDQVGNTWSWRRIQEVIPDCEHLIRLLPLSASLPPDRLVWLPSKNGKYDVRSGYGITSSDHIPDLQRTFNWQKNIWRLRTAPKIKHFLWKAAAEALPVGVQLVNRGIQIDFACKICGAPETVTHVIRDCQFARGVWELAPLREQHHLATVHVLEFLARIPTLTSLPPSGLPAASLPSWICWNLWTARNRRIFSDTVFSEQEVLTKAISDARIWQTAQETTHLSKCTPSGEPPTIVLANISCSVDAAWDATSQSCGLGIVFNLREENQTLTFSSSRRHVINHYHQTAR